MVKNSLARRATEGTPLAPAFEGAEGSPAVVWGGEDIVSLAKEVTRLPKEKEFAKFEARGGVMDGAKLSRRASQRSQQVAQPGRTDSACWSVRSCRPARRCASQLTARAARWPARSRRSRRRRSRRRRSTEAPAG